MWNHVQNCNIEQAPWQRSLWKQAPDHQASYRILAWEKLSLALQTGAINERQPSQ